jgi:hypothetical protein
MFALAFMVGFWEAPAGSLVVGGVFVTAFLAALAGVAAGLFVSSLTRTPDQAMAVLPLVVIPQLLLGGLLVAIRDMGALGGLISSFFAARWAFGALGNVMELEHHPALSPALRDHLELPVLSSLLLLTALSVVLVGIAVRLVAARGNTS